MTAFVRHLLLWQCAFGSSLARATPPGNSQSGFRVAI